MANKTHPKVSIKHTHPTEASPSPIQKKKKNVSNIMNELAMKGAKVVFQDTHVSGHACREELRLIYALTKPQYAIPVHGEYRHLVRHSELALEMGIPKENVFVMEEGDVLEINKKSGKVTGKVPAQGILVDGLGIGDVGNIVLNDRRQLSQNGLIIVTVTLEKHGNSILAGPDIVSRGFVYVTGCGRCGGKLSHKKHYRLGQVKVLYPGHAEQLYLEEDEEGSDDPSDHYRSIKLYAGKESAKTDDDKG